MASTKPKWLPSFSWPDISSPSLSGAWDTGATLAQLVFLHKEDYKMLGQSTVLAFVFMFMLAFDN